MLLARQAPVTRRALALAGVAAVLGSGLLGAGEVIARPQRRSSASSSERTLTRRPARARRRAQAKAFLGFGGKSDEEQYSEDTLEIIKQMRVRRRSVKRSAPGALAAARPPG